MDRLRCGRSTDSDGRSLRIAGPERRAGAGPLDCSGRSEEGDAGRARLDRVEGRDSRRTGPSRTSMQDVPLGANGTPMPVTGAIGDDGIIFGW